MRTSLRRIRRFPSLATTELKHAPLRETARLGLARKALVFLVATLALFVAATLGPVDAAYAGAPETAQQAVAAYSEAQNSEERAARLAGFARAEALFRRAIEEGASNAEVELGAATAALQAEKLGPAILGFRRALAQDPNHKRAAHNLRHARSLLPGWVPRPGEKSTLDSFFFWHRLVGRDTRAGAGALAFALFGILVGVWLVRRAGWIRNAALLPLVVWIGAIGSLWADERSGVLDQAVLVTEETAAKAADSAQAPARFAEALPAGTEVTVLDERDLWARVELASGQDAWVARSSYERIERGR